MKLYLSQRRIISLVCNLDLCLRMNSWILRSQSFSFLIHLSAYIMIHRFEEHLQTLSILFLNQIQILTQSSNHRTYFPMWQDYWKFHPHFQANAHFLLLDWKRLSEGLQKTILVTVVYMGTLLSTKSKFRSKAAFNRKMIWNL